MATEAAQGAKAIPGRRPAVVGRAATVREDVIMMLLAILTLGGGSTDVWAHTNKLSQIKPEGFFTPYHAMLYAGLLTTSAWTIALAYRRRFDPGVTKWWKDGWPIGYRLGGVGALCVVFGGWGDMMWHTFFGIETGLDAQLSPTHLVIFLGVILLCSSPMRSWWASGEGMGVRGLAAVFSATFPGVMGVHTFTFLSAFGSTAPTRQYLHDQNGPSESAVIAGFNSYIVTTALLLIPIMWTLRRKAAPGIITAVFFMDALFEMIRYEFKSTMFTAAVFALVGAAMADVAVGYLDQRRGRNAPLRLPIAGAITPLLVWGMHMLGLEVADKLRWSAELWCGTLVMLAALGGLIGGLAAGPAAEFLPDAGSVAPAVSEA